MKRKPSDYTAGEVGKHLTFCNDQPECRRILLMYGLEGIGTPIVPPGVCFVPFLHESKRCVATATKDAKGGEVQFFLMGLPDTLPEAVCSAFFSEMMAHVGETFGGAGRIEIMTHNPMAN